MTTNRMTLDLARHIEAVADEADVKIWSLACYNIAAPWRVVVQLDTTGDTEKLARALSWTETDRDEYHPAEDGLPGIASIYGTFNGVTTVRLFAPLPAEVTR